MASMPGGASPASGHDTDTPGSFSKTKRKFSHTTQAQREQLLQWLEFPGNFELLTKPVVWTPSGGAASPPSKKPRKVDGYRSLAQYMNRVALTDWTEKTARSRFESFMSGYRKARRQGSGSEELQSIYQRVDALFGPDGDNEGSRFRSESLGQKSEGSRSPPARDPQVFHELAGDHRRSLLSDEQDAASPKRSVWPTRPIETKDERDEPPSSPLHELTAATASTPSEQALRVESQRLAVRQLELELKQSELRARQDENRQKLRAEVLTKLVEAGKSPAEVREYLAIMDPVDNTPRR